MTDLRIRFERGDLFPDPDALPLIDKSPSGIWQD